MFLLLAAAGTRRHVPQRSQEACFSSFGLASDLSYLAALRATQYALRTNDVRGLSSARSVCTDPLQVGL